VGWEEGGTGDGEPDGGGAGERVGSGEDCRSIEVGGGMGPVVGGGTAVRRGGRGAASTVGDG
jgi:hypothetical protein